ncbi:hypothetical protein COOONC_05643 [Cooperia oncophora]
MERHKKLERESLGRNPSRDREQQDKSLSERRSRSAQPKSRSSSMSGSFANPENRDNKALSPSGRKQTAAIRPFNSADDRVVRAAYEHPTEKRHPPAIPSASTPLRRSVPGRMSVRVTRKEKENTATDEDCNRNTARTMK